MVSTLILMFVFYCIVCWVGMLIWLLVNKEAYFGMWGAWIVAPIAVPFLLWEWITD